MSRPQLTARPPHSIFFVRGVFFACVAFLLAAQGSARADWLVTVEGELIETQSEWRVVDGEVIFTGVDGEERRLALESVDLEASRETTAMKSGRAYEPSPKVEALEKPPAEMKAPEPKITLYMTSWCGYCRRTADLLEKLEVAFVKKDIEKDPAAAQEYRKKGNGYRGIPLLDIDGTIIKGFRSEVIYRLVHDLKRQEAAARHEAAGASS